MISFDAFQRPRERDASITSVSNHQPHEAEPAKTLVTPTRSVHSDLDKSDLPIPAIQKNENQTITKEESESGASGSKTSAADLKEWEIVRLQHQLTKLKTTNKAKEILLCSTKVELKDARDTLNTTFSEYCSLRDELKMIKQKIIKEHQAMIYRKDIELFALRKGNEQKEKYIKDHDAKLNEVYHQQKATIDLKDAQLEMLKERLAALERQRSSRCIHEQEHKHKQKEEGDHAVQVRMLRIRKGRASRSSESLDGERSETDEEKDMVIAALREQLAVAKKATGEVVNQQAELQRAWDIVKKSQASLKAERELHNQTKEQLQDSAVMLEEGDQQRNCANTISRLPTIAEDKDELEAMFDSVQKDNLRLHAEVEALEKRLRDANARMFGTEQAAEQLRVQLRQEQSISDDLENARPSVVHRVHFQRMETQLRESRDALVVKEREVALLRETLTEKIDAIASLHTELDAAISFHTQDQDEIERLKSVITELQTTKEQLMRDHERLAAQRSRQCIASTDRNSTLSSGATLVQQSSQPLAGPSGEAEPIEALPSMPVPSLNERKGSVQQAPKTHGRSASSTTLLLNDVPSAELRGLKRRSWGVRAYVKKMVGKEARSTEEAHQPTQNTTDETKRGRAALPTKDKNALLRPSTAAAAVKPVSSDPFRTPATSISVPLNIKTANKRKHTLRYYAPPLKYSRAEDEERPKTAAGVLKWKDDSSRPLSSRKSWGATNKLKRRSMS